MSGKLRPRQNRPGGGSRCASALDMVRAFVPTSDAAACLAMASKLGSRIWVRTSNFEHPVDSVAKLLLKHPFNRKLQILFPQPADTVQAIAIAVLSGFYYKTQSNLSALVDVDFIQANLVDASLFCASADTNTRVAITPNGWLHFIVSKEQYQCLGLAGERVLGTGDYYITILLTNPDFKPGNAHYDRVKSRFQTIDGPIRLLCAREQAGQPMEAHLPELDAASSSECCAYEHKQRIWTAVPTPTAAYMQHLVESMNGNSPAGGIADPEMAAQAVPDLLHQLYEWIGGTSCSLQGSDWHDIPPNQMELVSLQQHSWTGLVVPQQVEQIVKNAQQLVCNGSCPWAIVSVWGMTGQPVSWLDTPPNKSMPMHDHNDYSICILPQNVYMLMVASGSADSFQTV